MAATSDAGCSMNALSEIPQHYIIQTAEYTNITYTATVLILLAFV